MGKRVFVDQLGRIWVEDTVVEDTSYLIDPYEVEKDRELPTRMVESCFKFGWNTDEDWVKENE